MMPDYIGNIPPQELIPFDVAFTDDTSILARLYYIGDEVSGIVDISTSLGGSIRFQHGALGSEVVDSDTNLDADGVGIINLDEPTEVTTFHSLQLRINSSDNWRLVLEGALPDDEAHTTTVGHLLAVTGGDCTGNDGYAIKSDCSGSFYVAAGLTQQGHPNKLHNTDHQVLHRITRVAAKSTYASGTSAIYIYACDDDNGTKELVKTLAAGATTVTVAYPAATTPAVEILGQAVGKRLVAILKNSAAMGTVIFNVSGYSYIFGPSARKGHMHVDNLD